MSEPAFEQIELSPALPRKGRRLFRAFLALVFSLVAPGLGQIYARQPYRGLLFGAVYLLALFLQGAFGTLKTPTGFAVFVCWSIGVGLLIVIDSARLGWKKGNETQPPSSKLAAWGAAIVLLVFSAVRASDWYTIRYFHIKAFKVPSMSMCPTVCEGDRVIVDTTAFKIHPPTRGDVIIFTPPTGGAPFIRRVIGVAGDVVKPSPGKMILVDGVAPPRPQVCGKPPLLPEQAEAIDFLETAIPSGSLFVVGDNLGNSFDSRIPGFGFAKPEQVIGKPLFLYWSFDAERIGCEIR